MKFIIEHVLLNMYLFLPSECLWLGVFGLDVFRVALCADGSQQLPLHFSEVTWCWRGAHWFSICHVLWEWLYLYQCGCPTVARGLSICCFFKVVCQSESINPKWNYKTFFWNSQSHVIVLLKLAGPNLFISLLYTGQLNVFHKVCSPLQSEFNQEHTQGTAGENVTGSPVKHCLYICLTAMLSSWLYWGFVYGLVIILRESWDGKKEVSTLEL